MNPRVQDIANARPDQVARRAGLVSDVERRSHYHSGISDTLDVEKLRQIGFCARHVRKIEIDGVGVINPLLHFGYEFYSTFFSGAGFESLIDFPYLIGRKTIFTTQFYRLNAYIFMKDGEANISGIDQNIFAEHCNIRVIYDFIFGCPRPKTVAGRKFNIEERTFRIGITPVPQPRQAIAQAGYDESEDRNTKGRVVFGLHIGSIGSVGTTDVARSVARRSIRVPDVALSVSAP